MVTYRPNATPGGGYCIAVWTTWKMKSVLTFHSGFTCFYIYVDVIFFLTGGRGKQDKFFLTHIGYIRSPKKRMKKLLEHRKSFGTIKG